MNMSHSDFQDLVEKAKARVQDFRRFQELGLIPLDGDFFPSVHYPPITMYAPMTEEQIFETFSMPDDGMLDIYVHIPFCRSRCVFCHYPSRYRASDADKDRYLDALEHEMDFYMRRLGVDKIKARSILIGGGTPTDLTPAQLERFLKYFTARLDMSKMQQFNYDVDPSTLVGEDGMERLRLMREYGVDRLTIGVQSLDDDILKKMHRSHDSACSVESIENSKKFGYKINIEFIFGYPSQTQENWMDVVEKAIAQDVGEIQFYRLKVIPYGDQQGTIQNVRNLRPDQLPPPEEAVMMKQMAIDLLAKHGYNENLRRVFTKKRNVISMYAFNQCCNLLDQIGLGLTAFSSLRDRFILNVQSFEDYYRAIAENRLPLNRGIVRSKDEQSRWAIILPLKNYFIRKNLYRKVTGLSLDQVFQEKFRLLKEHGLIVETDTRVELTRLGAFFADDVVEQFLSRQYIPFPESNYADGPFNPYKASPDRAEQVPA